MNNRSQLPCVHFLCTACIRKMWPPGTRGPLTCPTCREVCIYSLLSLCRPFRSRTQYTTRTGVPQLRRRLRALAARRHRFRRVWPELQLCRGAGR